MEIGTGRIRDGCRPAAQGRSSSLLAALAAFMLLAGCSGKPVEPGSSKMPSASLTFPDGAEITVDVAATPKEHEYGLMNRTSLPQDYGMLFAFPREQSLEFWMKNTLVDLDMVFIDKNKTITAVYPDVPRSATFTPDANVARRYGNGQFVLELPAGDAARHHLQRGQAFKFSLPFPAE